MHFYTYLCIIINRFIFLRKDDSMNLNDIVHIDDSFYMNTFGKRTPVCFKSGKGIELVSTDGIVYMDFFAGIAVTSIGHSHPTFIKRVTEQLNNLVHCSNLYYIEAQALLAKSLVESSCADKIFFANSGAEANEGAIKLARIYFKKQGMDDKYEIITLEKSFHGRTITTLSATGQEKYSKPFAPLTQGFKKVAINDIEALKSAISPNTCAIMLEPVQGESGVYPCDKEYIKQVRELCDTYNILLIFDEIQTGMGRTGKLFAYEHFSVQPDIFTLAKALGNGIPIGAVCAKNEVAQAFAPGDHGSTFGGNPLACSAGLAVMDIIKEEKLVDNSASVGKYFTDKLNEAFSSDIIKEVRSLGLMLGVELQKPIAAEIKLAMYDKGYLIGNVGSNILRILPPLIITTEDVDKFISALKSSIQDE